MESSRQFGLKIWYPILFAIVMVAGMSLGYKLHDSLRNKRDIEAVVERTDRLESIIDLINDRYVDTINTNVLYRDAVKGIITHLDPHTVYISADKLNDLNNDLKGSFFGIGVTYTMIRDTMVFTSVIANGPASNAGLITGDKLINVSDTPIAGNSVPANRITEMLRGREGTKISIDVKDVASGQNKKIVITRGEVPLYSIDAAIMLDKETGYIKINRFSATTYNEFTTALNKLKKQGLHQLIIDLRQNPGGYVNAATSIADELLDGERPIVFTQGLHSERYEYKTENAGLFEQGKLAVLVDEESASASEILAGAIQDWDRGIIIGRRTFGKGLVQEQFDLDDGSALRLTIAHYYTPSGRSIQRSYRDGKEAYDNDYYERLQSGELTGVAQESAENIAKQTIADTTTYYTANHRLVKGGGGITPDFFVPYDSSRLSPGLLTLILSDELQTTIIDFYTKNYGALKSYRNVYDFSANFKNEQNILNNYLQQLLPVERSMVNKVLSLKTNKNYLLLQIKAQIAKILFLDNGYYAISAQEDLAVRKALNVLNKDGEYLHVISR